MKRERKKSGSVVGKWIAKYPPYPSREEIENNCARGNKKQQEFLRKKRKNER